MSTGDASPTRWREALSTFERLQGLGVAQQQRELETLGKEQPDLHALVRTLIRADAQAESQDFFAAGGVDVPASVVPGGMIGPYRIERSLGEGGMGEVWLGARADGSYEGQVAIKLLHGHLHRPGLRERFRREGQILANLSHPNIARMLDAGATDNGLRYLVLEYVDGERLDRWCEERHLPVSAGRRGSRDRAHPAR